MDNRDKDKNKDLIEEIENDDTPLDEGENPKDDSETPGHIDNPENEEKDDELILSDDEEIDEETGEIKKKVVTPPVKPTLPADEERYREQRREATILAERNKQLTDAFSKVDDVKEPAEDALKQAARVDGFEWEDLSTFEKSQFKKNYINEQKLSIVNNAVKGVKDIDEWAKIVDGFLDKNETDQTNKGLIGNESKFREFAMKQSHRGVDISILTSAFLHDMPQDKKNRGSLMLTNTGGERSKAKSNLDDADYVATLRKSDPKEYQRLLRTGKINIQL